MRVLFDELFTLQGEVLIPKVPVLICGFWKAPGVPLDRGVCFGSVDLASLAGKELDVVMQYGIYDIKGYVQ